MLESDGLDGLEEQVRGLEASLAGAQGMAAAFDGELARMRETMAAAGRDVAGLSNAVGRGLRAAFEGVVFDGMKLSDAMKGLALSISEAAYAAAIRPVQQHFGQLIAGGIENFVGGLLPFAKGGAFTQGRVVPFARGGIVSAPTMFPMRGGRGLMGEAGPEAIMPLARGADGRLGVEMQGGGRPVSVVMNISTPDVEGFRRSQGQIAAQVTRALGRGQRNR
ncbi:MAG: phage tail tape measure protein [Rhodobacteraceae bacterium]|nr:phage tail tape measure protein [Paracoccaceae bacterium]